MEKFTVDIELGNAAMDSHEDICDALAEIQKKLASGEFEGVVIDGNGNTVGTWAVVA